MNRISNCWRKSRIKIKKRDILDYWIIIVSTFTLFFVVFFEIRSEKPRFVVKGGCFDYGYSKAYIYDYFELVDKDKRLDGFFAQFNLSENYNRNEAFEWILFPQVFKLKITNRGNAFSITDYSIHNIKFSKKYKKLISIDKDTQGLYLLGEKAGDYQRLYFDEPINVESKETKVIYILVTFPILLNEQLIKELADKGIEYKRGDIQRIQAGKYYYGVKFNDSIIENGYCVKDVYVDFCHNLDFEFKLNLIINNINRKTEAFRINKE